MMRRDRQPHPWKPALVVGLVGWATLALGGATLALDDGNTLHGCVGQGAGALRVVDSAADCKTNEAPLEWNQQGTAGPAGPTGPPGPQGPAGAQGPEGPAGAGLDPPLRVRTGPGSGRLSSVNTNLVEAVEVENQIEGGVRFLPRLKPSTGIGNFIVAADVDGPVSFGSSPATLPQFGLLSGLRLCVFESAPRISIIEIRLYSGGQFLTTADLPPAGPGGTYFGCVPLSFDPVVALEPITVSIQLFLDIVDPENHHFTYRGAIATFEPVPAGFTL